VKQDKGFRALAGGGIPVCGAAAAPAPPLPAAAAATAAAISVFLLPPSFVFSFRFSLF